MRALSLRFQRWACFAGLLLTVASFGGCSDYDQARSAYEGGNYAEALVLLESLARQGDTKAQYDISLMYLQGIGAKQNLQLGWSWMLKAAEGGNTTAMVELGGRFENGVDLERNSVMAFSWYRKAAAAGDPVGRYNLALMYMRGDGVPQDFVRTYAWLILSDNAGNPAARFKMADLRDDMSELEIRQGEDLAKKLEQDPKA
jgi:TPR repeat protein